MFTGHGLPHIVHVICIAATVGVVTDGVVTVAAFISFRLVIAGTPGVVLSASGCWATCSQVSHLSESWRPPEFKSRPSCSLSHWHTVVRFPVNTLGNVLS